MGNTFGHYQTAYQLRHPSDKDVSIRDYYTNAMELTMNGRSPRPTKTLRNNDDSIEIVRAYASELVWYAIKRPYYNLYPSIHDMLLKNKFNLPCSFLQLPEPVIVVKCAKRHSFDSVLMSVMPSRDGEGDNFDYLSLDEVRKKSRSKTEHRSFVIVAQTKDSDEHIFSYFSLEPEAMLQEQINDYINEFPGSSDIVEALKLAIGISILQNGGDWFSPTILNRDREKYFNDETTEEQKEKMIARAVKANHGSIGIDIGRDLEEMIERESVSSHFRRPHMAWYYTGKGRKTPVYKLRQGSVVNRKKAEEIPTGYEDLEEK